MAFELGPPQVHEFSAEHMADPHYLAETNNVKVGVPSLEPVVLSTPVAQVTSTGYLPLWISASSCTAYLAGI